MLAEKFFLVLETLRSHARDHDWPEIVTSPIVTDPARSPAIPETTPASRRQSPVPDERA